MKKEELEKIYDKLILDIIYFEIREASMCNGEVFGEYVRDVMVPLMQESYYEKKIEYKVDLWFKSIQDHNKYINFVKDRSTSNYTYSLNVSPFLNYYDIYIGDKKVANVYLYISNNFPYSLFNIDRLSLKYEDTKLIAKTYAIEPIEILIDHILNKRAYALSNLLTSILSGDKNIENLCYYMMKNKYDILSYDNCFILSENNKLYVHEGMLKFFEDMIIFQINHCYDTVTKFNGEIVFETDPTHNKYSEFVIELNNKADLDSIVSILSLEYNKDDDTYEYNPYGIGSHKIKIMIATKLKGKVFLFDYNKKILCAYRMSKKDLDQYKHKKGLIDVKDRISKILQQLENLLTID